MQPKPHPMDYFIYHPAFCHLAPRRDDPGDHRGIDAKRPASARSPAARAAKRQSIARPGRHTIDQRLAALRATLRLPLPRVNIRTTYAAIAAKAVTVVTFVAAGLPRAPGRPSGGTGLFVRRMLPREDVRVGTRPASSVSR